MILGSSLLLSPKYIYIIRHLIWHLNFTWEILPYTKINFKQPYPWYEANGFQKMWFWLLDSVFQDWLLDGAGVSVFMYIRLYTYIYTYIRIYVLLWAAADQYGILGLLSAEPPLVQLQSVPIISWSAARGGVQQTTRDGVLSVWGHHCVAYSFNVDLNCGGVDIASQIAHQLF